MVPDRTRLPAWAATFVLLTLCLLPSSCLPVRESYPHRIPHLDKLVHVAMFAGFGFLWARAGRSRGRLRVGPILAWGLVLAVFTEVAQGLPQIARDPDVLDFLADALGAVVGVGLVGRGETGESPEG